MAEQQEDYSNLPLEERATHKVWKVRQGAYEEMKNIFEKSGHDSDTCFDPFVNNPSIVKKIVTDSNVVAQETGLAALNALLEFGGPRACLQIRSQVVGPLVEKTMGSTRSGTKQKALESLLLFIEMDTAEPVLEEMIPFLKHRTPKVVSGTTTALTEIFHQYGTSTVPYKSILQSMPALFGHADKNVRAAAQALSVELFRWLGDSFKNVLFPNLKPVQQKDLESEFEKVKGESPKRERYLRSQKEAMERQQANGISTDGDTQYEEDEDVEMDLFDPVEVLSKIPPNFNTQITSAKWKERKEALEELNIIVKQPKLQDGDYSDLIRTLAKCMKDANIQVVSLAANSVESVAKGLRSDFAKYRPVILSPMLERLKEKKQSVSEALSNALDALYQCTSLSDILDETLEFLKHKTPQVKIETAKFVSRCLSTTKTMPSSGEIKSIIEHSIKLLSDTQEPVRSGGAQILGIVMKLIGERAMNPFLEPVDDIKKNKIKEWYEKSEVKAKPKMAGRTQPSSSSIAGSNASAAMGGAAASATRGGASAGFGRGGLPLRKRVLPGGAAAATFNARAKAEESSGSTLTRPGALGSRRPGFASPSKLGTRASPFGSSEPMEDVTPTQLSANAPKANSGRGLTGRSLIAQGRTTGGGLSPVESELIAQERQELERLKQENKDFQKQKEKLHWEIQESKSEKTHLLSEIQDLKEKNAKLNDEHTHDVLTIKSRDTQLTRSQTDLETARLRINQLEQEMDNLRQQLAHERTQSRLLQNHSSSSNMGSASPMSAHRQTHSISTSRFGNSGYSSNLRSPQRPTSLYGSPRRDWQSQQPQQSYSVQPTPQRGQQSPKTPVRSSNYVNRYDGDTAIGYGSPGVGEDTIMDGTEESEETGFNYDSQTPITTTALEGDKKPGMYEAGNSATKPVFSNATSHSVSSLGFSHPEGNGRFNNDVGASNRVNRISTYRPTGSVVGSGFSPHLRSQSSIGSRADGGLGIRPGFGGGSTFDSNNDSQNHSSGYTGRSASRFGDHDGLRYPGTSNSDKWLQTSQMADHLKQRIEMLKRRADASKMQFDSDNR